MKISNENIMSSTQWLSKINSMDIDDINLAFKVSTIINKINAAIKPIEEIRNKIIKDETLKDKDGNPLFADENKQLIQLTEEGGKKLTTLMSLESEIEFEQLTREELKTAGVKTKPIEIKYISWLIK